MEAVDALAGEGSAMTREHLMLLALAIGIAALACRYQLRAGVEREQQQGEGR